MQEENETIIVKMLNLRIILPMNSGPAVALVNWVRKLHPEMPFYDAGLRIESGPAEGFYTTWILQALEEGGFKPLHCSLYEEG